MLTCTGSCASVPRSVDTQHVFLQRHFNNGGTAVRNHRSNAHYFPNSHNIGRLKSSALFNAATLLNRVIR